MSTPKSDITLHMEQECRKQQTVSVLPDLAVNTKAQTGEAGVASDIQACRKCPLMNLVNHFIDSYVVIARAK